MDALRLRARELAQSTLVIAPMGEWESLWAEIAALVHPADAWRPESWEKAPAMSHLKDLHRHAVHTPVKKIKAAVVPHADILSKETANSLLKLLEEPPAYLWTVLLAESANVLPTVKSRVRIIRLEEGIQSEATPRQRLARLLGSFDPSRPSHRSLASELLYAAPLVHQTVQLPVIEEGFRPTV